MFLLLLKIIWTMKWFWHTFTCWQVMFSRRISVKFTIDFQSNHHCHWHSISRLIINISCSCYSCKTSEQWSFLANRYVCTLASDVRPSNFSQIVSVLDLQFQGQTVKFDSFFCCNFKRTTINLTLTKRLRLFKLQPNHQSPWQLFSKVKLRILVFLLHIQLSIGMLLAL